MTTGAKTTHRANRRPTAATRRRRSTHPAAGTVFDPIVQSRNHTPHAPWDPMLDYAMMSRFNRDWAIELDRALVQHLS